MEMITVLLRDIFKFFFIITPFFVLSMFLSMTNGWEEPKKRKLALRVTSAVWVASLALLFFGPWIFQIFGITVDAFRIGGGALLFLSAVALVNQTPQNNKNLPEQSDIAVVPLAIPVTVGPATTAVLFVVGAENHTLGAWLLTACALSIAIAALGCLLVSATRLERLLGHRGLSILSKLTGLILSALAAQMIFTGVKAFLK